MGFPYPQKLVNNLYTKFPKSFLYFLKWAILGLQHKSIKKSRADSMRNVKKLSFLLVESLGPLEENYKCLGEGKRKEKPR